MKRVFLLAAVGATVAEVTSAGASCDWENLSVSSIGRLPPCTCATPCGRWRTPCLTSWIRRSVSSTGSGATRWRAAASGTGSTWPLKVEGRELSSVRDDAAGAHAPGDELDPEPRTGKCRLVRARTDGEVRFSDSPGKVACAHGSV